VDSKYAFVYGIYKDTIKSQDPKSEYKLRPNACIAIAVAPELFSVNRAYRYLRHVERILLGHQSLGVKTLDPREEEYVPYYDNEDDSHHYKIAHGFSYHNGPEWVWIYGMFLKAGISCFSNELSFAGLMSFLSRHKRFIHKNVWLSLPEITNHNGEYCKFSCPAQSWSIAVLLEAYYEAKVFLKNSYI
jgi:glycogen debranching enzyme